MTIALRQSTIPDSPLSRWDVRWKLAALLLFSFGIASLRSPMIAGTAFVGTLLLTAFARIPRAVVLSRLGLLAFAVAPALVIVPFTLEGGLRFSERGLFVAFGVSFRAFAIGLLALILLRTAPPTRTFAAAHSLWLPGVLVQIAQLAHRYAFVLADEARRMRTAMRTRGFRARTNSHSYRTLGHAIGGLLVRGGDRAETVSAAMRCRGFDGTYRTTTAFRTTSSDVFGFVVIVGFTLGLVIWDRVKE